jgi:phenol 2-monooxygenase
VPLQKSRLNFSKATKPSGGKIARELIEFDTKFSTMLSGKITASRDFESSSGLTHGHFLDVFSIGSGFTSGCGIEYPASNLIRKQGQGHAALMKRLSLDGLANGALFSGRRLMNASVLRHADGNSRHSQDEISLGWEI